MMSVECGNTAAKRKVSTKLMVKLDESKSEIQEQHHSD